MRRTVSVLIVVLAGIIVSGAPPRLGAIVLTARAAAAEPRMSVPGGLCSLWTERQVSRAMKEPMEVVRNDPDRCVWYGEATGSGAISTASVGLWAGNPTSPETFIDQARVSGPRWADESQAAGIPVLRTEMTRAGRAREIKIDAFPDPTTWMTFGARSERGTNVRTALNRLIEIAVAQLVSTATASASPAASDPAASDPAASAGTSPAASPAVQACALLTPDEVSAALGGGAITVVGDHPQNCVYSGEEADDPDTGLVVTLALGAPETGTNIDTARATYPDAVEVAVAGVPALQTPAEPLETGWTRSAVHVFSDAATWLILEGAAPGGVDIAAALVGLAGLAVPRLAALATSSPAPSSPSPGPSEQTGLAGLFPTQIGGNPVTVQTMPLAGGGGFMSTDQLRANRRLTRRLESQDRSIDDVLFGVGQTASQGAGIIAIQAPGADIAPLVDPLLELLSMEKVGVEVTPEAVAGRAAFAVSQGGGPPGYAYPRNDVLWIVFAEGGEVTEIFEQLP